MEVSGQFQLEIGDHPAVATFNQLDAFTQGYIKALYWTAGFHTLSFEQLDAGALIDIKNDCEKFQRENIALLLLACSQKGYDRERAGHDFLLTRCGHGAGFWDRSELEDVMTPQGAPLATALSTASEAFGECYAYHDGDDENISEVEDEWTLTVFYNN